jgi:hypothetical protein
VLDPKAGRGDRKLLARRQIVPVGNRKERDAVEIDAANARIGIEEDIEEEMSALVGPEPNRCPGKKQPNRRSALRT